MTLSPAGCALVWVTKVRYNDLLKVQFLYNDKGFRSKKISYNTDGLEIKSTYYVRDASGSTLAVYEANWGVVYDNFPMPPSYGEESRVLKELPIYGASRLGIYNKTTHSSVYQLTDHLGNVRAVISKQGTNAVALVSATDYYPFGMPMPGRQIVGGEPYRYSFQGQEKDSETGKEAFQLRLWDSRIGRWLTTDPYRQYHSPYVGMGNDPINGIDLDGGYKTWFGAFTAWLGGGFKGGVDHAGGGGDMEWAVSNTVMNENFGNNGDDLLFTVQKNYGLSYPLSGSPLNSSGGVFSNYNFAGNPGSNMATFNANRSKGRKHAARDLYTSAGTEVKAIGSGEILSVGAFYAGTNQVTVRHNFSVDGNIVNAIVRYGELSPLSTSSLFVGQSIENGYKLGKTGSLLKSNGKPVLTINKTQIYMLHLEVYSGLMGYDLVRNPLTNRSNRPFQRRTDLIDANKLLQKIKN